MVLLNIKKYPEPVLRKRSEEIGEITEEIKNLVFDMIEILKESGGMGLAAPQVGELKRIIIINPVEERTREEEGDKGYEVFINPKITSKSRETEIMEEGCLSFPGIYLNIRRPKMIEFESLDINGNKVRLKADGLSARIFQHEIDHLNGVLIIDRINFFQKMKTLIRFKIKSRKI